MKKRLLLVVFEVQDEQRADALKRELTANLFLKVTPSAWVIGADLPLEEITQEMTSRLGFTMEDRIVFFDITDSKVYPFRSLDWGRLVEVWRYQNRESL